LGFRPDLAVALGGAGLIILWTQRHRWRPILGGLAIGLVPYLYLIATAGPSNVIRNLVTDPLFHLRAGRNLPLPPSFHWTGEFFSRVQQYIDTLSNRTWYGAPLSVEIAEFFWLLVFVLVVLIVAAWRSGRQRNWTLLGLFVFAILLSTNIMQRADISHMRLVGTVWLGLFPLAIALAVRHWFPRHERVVVVAPIALALVATLAAPVIAVANFADLIGLRSDFATPRNVLAVNHRSIQAENPIEAITMAEAAVAVREVSAPGERFFEGPTDLRFANYNEPIFYWLEPQLRPATYYLEVNPGITNTAHSGLAQQIATADVLLLSNRYANFSEPNSSTTPGSNAPNAVVKAYFCVERQNGWYTVLRRMVAGVSYDTTGSRSGWAKVGPNRIARCGSLGTYARPIPHAH
jgi:hypothetical protein